MEEIKKQILLINLANYNETVNNMSKFKLNDREIKLFCDIMQQFAEKYHTEQLRTHDVVGQSEQLVCEYCNEDAKPTCCDSCLGFMVNAGQKAN